MCSLIIENCIIHFLTLIQGWRVAYYGSGIFGLIIAFLCACTIYEPKRTTIGEEVEEAQQEAQTDNKEKQVANPQAEEKEAAWKVMLEPRLIMLCIAASIRHTGGWEVG